MKVLIDSDFLVGLFRVGDPHHEVTMTILKQHNNGSSIFHVLNLVLQETATVLSHRVGMEAVRLFHAKYPKLGLNIIDMDKEIELAAWQIFLEQTKKGTSFIDCANLATCRHYAMDKIFSFDRFYPKELLLPVVQ